MKEVLIQPETVELAHKVGFMSEHYPQEIQKFHNRFFKKWLRELPQPENAIIVVYPKEFTEEGTIWDYDIFSNMFLDCKNNPKNQ